jgi:predicted flap endonuclease-1-like 5' DNA nuclease
MPDLQPLRERLETLAAAVAAMPRPAPAPDLTAALQPLATRLGVLEQRLSSLHIPEAAPVDLQPVQQRLHSLEQAVAGIRIPAMPAMPSIPPAPDLAPMQRQLEGLAQAVAALPRSQAPAPAVDLGPTQERLGRVEQAVREIRIPAAADLAPVNERLRELEQRVAAIRIPAPSAAPDLAPLVARIDALGSQLTQLAQRAPAAAAAPRPIVRAGSRNLLTRPAHGKPDDLKRIVGVAEVLEKMLHRVGVYYFWQIAEWDAADIDYVDRQLTAFNGRIKRDEWVTQARQFVREGGVAAKPVEA